MIQLRNISLDLQAHRIFQDVSCVISNGDRVGIIGKNGAGKSTLLKVIAGLIKPSEGQISIQRDVRIAYLPQEDILSSPLSVFDEALSAFTVMFETEQKIRIIEEALERGTHNEQLLEDYGDLQQIIKEYDKHKAVQQTHEVLGGLGFTESMTQKMVSELSTGWKMRLALAKLLLTKADVFLFDEPTNHLDIVTQQWFLQKLQAMKESFLLISHERAYLEKVCNRTLEIERGKVIYYHGNLQDYLREKKAQQEMAQSTRARQEREIQQKQEIVNRFRASANRARLAQSMIKQIERIELVEVEPPLPTIQFSFPKPERSGSVVLKLNNVGFKFQELSLFRSVCAEIQRGERIALVAANGVGKSTLIKCITGVYSRYEGTIAFGHNVRWAYFQQDQAEALDKEKTIFEEVYNSCKSPELEIRKILGSFQFKGDDIYKKIQVLSGGEKNRVAMVKVLLQKANVLILDEPTNHLDLYAKDVLRQALESYEGTIIFVSHDLDFVNKLATRIIELTPQGAFSYPGTYEEYISKNQTHVAPKERTAAPESNRNKRTVNDEDLTMLRKQERQLAKTIDTLEKNYKRECDQCALYEYESAEYQKSLQKITNLQEKIDKAQQEWESLIEKLDGQT